MSKVMGILSNDGYFYNSAHQNIILGKATKFQVEKLPTSEVISKEVGGKHPSAVSLGLILFLLYKFSPYAD